MMAIGTPIGEVDFLANLRGTRDNLMLALATESANPRVSYSVSGRSVPWNEFRASLLAEIMALDDLLIKHRLDTMQTVRVIPASHGMMMGG